MKTTYIFLLIGLMLLQSCSAQEQQQDTLPKELEFINVSFPENIKTITYQELNDNLMKQGAKKMEDPHFNRYTEYTKILENGFKIKLKLDHNSAKDSIFTFELSGDVDYFYQPLSLEEVSDIAQKDTLSESEYENIVAIINKNGPIVSKQLKIISDFVMNRIKKIYPIINQEPQESTISKSGKYTTEKVLWWKWTKEQVQTDIDELALVTFNVRESNVSTPYRYYIKNKKSIRIGIIEWGFIIGFEYAIYYNYGYK